MSNLGQQIREYLEEKIATDYSYDYKCGYLRACRDILVLIKEPLGSDDMEHIRGLSSMPRKNDVQ